MDLRSTYGAILDIQAQLQDELLQAAAYELQQTPSLRSAPDHRKVQALAAATVLQAYLADQMALQELREDLMATDALAPGGVEQTEEILATMEALDPKPWMEKVDVDAKFEDLIYGYTIDEWNALSEDEQIQIQDRCEYDLQHPEQKDWDVPY